MGVTCPQDFSFLHNNWPVGVVRQAAHQISLYLITTICLEVVNNLGLARVPQIVDQRKSFKLIFIDITTYRLANLLKSIDRKMKNDFHFVTHPSSTPSATARKFGKTLYHHRSLYWI